MKITSADTIEYLARICDSVSSFPADFRVYLYNCDGNTITLWLDSYLNSQSTTLASLADCPDAIALYTAMTPLFAVVIRLSITVCFSRILMRIYYSIFAEI